MVTIEPIKDEVIECRSVAGWNGRCSVYKVFFKNTLIAVVEYKSHAAPYEGGYVHVDVSPRYTLPCPAYRMDYDRVMENLKLENSIYSDNAIAVYGAEAELVMVKSYSGKFVQLHFRTDIDTPFLDTLFRRILEWTKLRIVEDLALELFQVKPAERYEPELHRVMTCKGERLEIAGVAVFDLGVMAVNGEERRVAVLPASENGEGLAPWVLSGLFGKRGYFKFGSSQRSAHLELLFFPQDRKEVEEAVLSFIREGEWEMKSAVYPRARPVGVAHTLYDDPDGPVEVYKAASAATGLTYLVAFKDPKRFPVWTGGYDTWRLQKKNGDDYRVRKFLHTKRNPLERKDFRRALKVYKALAPLNVPFRIEHFNEKLALLVHEEFARATGLEGKPLGRYIVLPLSAAEKVARVPAP